MLTIERVALTVAYRWWDFGADAYVVRRITDFFLLPLEEPF